jgi:hypothetical protein
MTLKVTEAIASTLVTFGLFTSLLALLVNVV